jgi:hypothetical protein
MKASALLQGNSVGSNRETPNSDRTGGTYASSSDEPYSHGCDGEPDDLVPLLLHPVLSCIGADYIGRSKLTGWQTPAATHNGGWCMCVKSGKDEVCIYYCGGEQHVLAHMYSPASYPAC